MLHPRVFHGNIATAKAFALSVTSEADTFEKKFALESSPKNTFQSTSQTNQYYTLTGTIARNIKGCVIVNTIVDIAGGDTLELQTSDDDFFTAPDESQTFIQVPRVVAERDQETDHIIQRTYFDYYTLLDVTRKDYRVFADRVSGSYVDYGKIYLFSGDYIFDQAQSLGESTGLLSVHSDMTGDFGLSSSTFRYQQEVTSFTIPAVTAAQKNTLLNEVSASPFSIWHPGGIGSTFHFGKMRATVPDMIFKNTALEAWRISMNFEGAV